MTAIHDGRLSGFILEFLCVGTFFRTFCNNSFIPPLPAECFIANSLVWRLRGREHQSSACVVNNLHQPSLLPLGAHVFHFDFRVFTLNFSAIVFLYIHLLEVQSLMILLGHVQVLSLSVSNPARLLAITSFHTILVMVAGVYVDCVCVVGTHNQWHSEQIQYSNFLNNDLKG